MDVIFGPFRGSAGDGATALTHGPGPPSVVGAGSRPVAERGPCTVRARACEHINARGRGGPSSVCVAPWQGRCAGHVLGLSG